MVAKESLAQGFLECFFPLMKHSGSVLDALTQGSPTTMCSYKEAVTIVSEKCQISEAQAKEQLTRARRLLRAGGRKGIVEPITLVYVAILKVTQDRFTKILVYCGASQHAAEVIVERAFVASTPYVPDDPCTLQEALQSLDHTVKEAARLFDIERSQTFN